MYKQQSYDYVLLLSLLYSYATSRYKFGAEQTVLAQRDPGLCTTRQVRAAGSRYLHDKCVTQWAGHGSTSCVSTACAFIVQQLINGCVLVLIIYPNKHSNSSLGFEEWRSL